MVDCVKYLFFNYTDSSFNFWHMLILAGQVDTWTTWYSLNQRLECYKLTISVHCHNPKSSMKIILINLLESLEDVDNTPVG
jgi:hypothetical protein